MAVLVWDRVHELTDELLQLANFSSLSCGVILARCAPLNQKVLEQLKSFMSKNEPGHAAKYFFDDRNLVLAVVLEDQKLATTHYTSLVLKNFLESHRLLEGQMAVASFPECGELTEWNMSQFIQQVMHPNEESKDIRLFVDQSIKEGILSILVVDTDEMVREFIKLRLELKGYVVYEAKDGHEALEKYSQLSPDLMITELNLPIIDGYQLINRIMKNNSDAGKVIVLTDKHSSGHMNRAFELGVSDYVTKPFSISELEWRIKRLDSIH